MEKDNGRHLPKLTDYAGAVTSVELVKHLAHHYQSGMRVGIIIGSNVYEMTGVKDALAPESSGLHLFNFRQA